MNLKHATLAAGSLAFAVAAFPGRPRFTFAPDVDNSDPRIQAAVAAAKELKRVTDEVKDWATSTRASFEAPQRAIESGDDRMTRIEQKLACRGGRFAEAGAAVPSLGEAVISSEEFKSLAGTSNQRGSFRIGSTRDALEVKNITTATGSGAALLPPDFRADPVALPYRKLSIHDLVAPGETTANSVTYPKMTGRTNNAATVAEGNLKPQSDLGFALTTAPVQTLAHFFVGSRQMMDDAPALRSLIDVQARYGLRVV